LFTSWIRDWEAFMLFLWCLELEERELDSSSEELFGKRRGDGYGYDLKARCEEGAYTCWSCLYSFLVGFWIFWVLKIFFWIFEIFL